MTITYWGHSCFRVEQDGYVLVLDPFTQIPGLPDTAGTADAVLCSHGHFDHNYTALLHLSGRQDSPFTIRKMDVFHDDKGGALRGPNQIHILSAGGVTLAHLGDLGHQLTAEQVSELGPLNPRIVVPMHYRSGEIGLPVLQPVEDFLSLRPAGEIRRYDLEGISSLTVTADTPAQTAVLAIANL